MPGDPVITYSQQQRLLQIKTVDGLTELLLERFSGAEILSKPFEFKVTLLSPDDSVKLKDLLRTDVTVTIYLSDGTPRYFNGVFLTLSQAKEAKGGEDETPKQSGILNPSRELAVYEGVIVPKIWFLGLNNDCKIFQTMSVIDIVTKVLNDANISDFQFSTLGTYPARDYCVQYRESSLEFISRLLEEEGIYYYFSHTETKHTIVFADKNTAGGPCPGQDTVEYSYDQKGWVGSGQEGIATLERIESAYTGKVARTDYNFETPSLSLMSTLADSNEEHYDYPGEFSTKDDGERYARIRLEELEAQQFVVNGTSRCRAFRPGYTFKLKGHYRTDTNGDYFLTAVSHMVFDASYRQEKGKAHEYRNSFTAIPKTVPYRPQRVTTRPTVHGLQPAVVVGKSGEEIWVDKYGRVKVQFFWDRVGQKNENSSCWVRVSQIWAGKNWGWITIPRIGQEVLIDFLEGDPDRPIVVGRVYNAEQMPPYTLPANQTQSGIKTRSSKQGTSDNFNEIQFEDLKGSELISVHAEKDMSTVVEHDDTQHIQNDRTINVDGKHTETIIKDTSITITQGNHSLDIQTGNQSITVDTGNQSTEIKMGNQSIKLDMGNQTTELSMGNQSTTLDLGNKSTVASLGSISFEAMQSITLTVGSSSIVINQMGVTISGMMITITGEAMTTVEGEAMLTLQGGITMIN